MFQTMLRRFYYATNVQYSKKQGIMLSKMLNPSKKKKSSYYDILPTTMSLVKTTKQPAKQATRRVAALNKLFMKYITDLMATGNLSINILGRGIEISKVKISPDFQMLNVYWMCKGTLTDIESEKILNSIAGPLRHELSSLRLMGEVPYITFLKDQQEAHIYNIDQCLAQADYGDDYVLTEIGHVLKTEFSLDTKLSPEMKAKIKQMEEQFPTEEIPLPEMTNNVYGLDQDRIVNRLLAARKKSQDAWKRVNEDESVISYRTVDSKPNNVEPVDFRSQRKELAEFLIKRQALENKLHKEMMNLRKDRDVKLESYVDEEETYEEDDHYFDDDKQFDDEIDFYDDGEHFTNDKLKELKNKNTIS